MHNDAALKRPANRPCMHNIEAKKFIANFKQRARKSTELSTLPKRIGFGRAAEQHAARRSAPQNPRTRARPTASAGTRPCPLVISVISGAAAFA